MGKVRGVYEHPTGSGIWWAQYFVHGKRHRERAGNKTNAIKLYHKRKTEALTDAKFPELRRRRVTLGELMDDAVAFARTHNKSAGDTAEKAALARPALGALHADSIDPAIFTAWIDRRGVANATFNRYKSFFSLCYREGMIAGKITLNLAKLIRRRKEPSGRKRYLNRTREYPLLMSKIHTADQRLKFLVSVQTGMRLTEQFTVEWPQLDWELRDINLTRTKNGDDRTIPMTSDVYRELRAEWVRRGRPKKGLVFLRPFGGKAEVQVRWFTAAVRRAGIDDYTWHNNRHTFCSWLAIAGKPLKTIQELAGHKTISITAKYAHLSPNPKRAAIEAMATGPTATKTAIGRRTRIPA